MVAENEREKHTISKVCAPPVVSRIRASVGILGRNTKGHPLMRSKALQTRTGRRTRHRRTFTFEVEQISEPKHRPLIRSGSLLTG
jgi:hypothetical protein